MTAAAKEFSKADIDAAKAWPFQEARNLIKRMERMKGHPNSDPNRPVIFETGYGPSAAYRHVSGSRAHHHGAPGV